MLLLHMKKSKLQMAANQRCPAHKCEIPDRHLGLTAQSLTECAFPQREPGMGSKRPLLEGRSVGTPL